MTWLGFRYFTCIALLISLVTAPYNPRHPPRTENFDPQQANPDGRITCQGNSQIPLPRLLHFDPNQKTLQELCVKPQYNGGRPWQHVGGYCAYDLVMFDPSTGARVSQALFNTRMLLQCLLRCHCSNHDPSILAGPAEGQDSENRQVGGRPYIIKPDLVDDFNNPQARGLGEWAGTAWAMEVIKAVEVPLRGYQANGIDLINADSHLTHAGLWSTVDTVLDPANQILFCHGSLPTWQLPGPVTWDDFSGQLEDEIAPLEHLCFNILDGGNE